MNNITLSATLARRDERSARPPQAVLDAIADRKISGGYKIGRVNRCRSCFEARSANGTCSCSPE